MKSSQASDKLIKLIRKTAQYCESGSYSSAKRVCKQILKIDKNSIDALQYYAFAHQKESNYRIAIEYYLRAINVLPENIDGQSIWFNLGVCYEEDSEWEKAIEAYSKVLECNMMHTKALLRRASIHNNLGNHKEALIDYKQIVFFPPQSDEMHQENRAIAHSNIMRSPVVVPDDHDVECLKNDMQMECDIHAKINYLFALAIGLEKQGKFNEAFDALQQANKLKRDTLDFDIGIIESLMQAYIDTYSQDLIQKFLKFRDEIDSYIFIVGLPRSGTTLLETIISGHEDVYPAGELSLMEENLHLAFSATNNKYKLPEGLSHLKDKQIVKLRDHYLKNTKKYIKKNHYMTDKMPGNFWHIGMILSFFPNSKVIDIRKKPIDACLSLYKQNFRAAHNYSYDLNDCKKYYRLYEKLMGYWDQVFPGAVLHIAYEDLIQDKDACCKNIFNYLGLEWNPEYLKLSENKRVVKTASSTQVRGEVYKHSLDFWRNYEHQLSDLKNEFKEYY